MIDSANFTASAHSAARSSSEMCGAGAISTTFWCRRWIEQSRSNRCRVVPWVSARICTSMCRGRPTACSMNAVGSPNAPSASRMAARAPRAARRVVHPAHAPTAAAGDRLDEDREADLLRAGHQLVQVGRRRRGLQGRDARGPGRLQRPDLVAGQLQHVGRRPDEGDAGVVAGPGQIGVLAQEAVAGIDRVSAGLPGGPDDLGDVEIGADRVPALADQVGLVGLDPVDRVAVLVREDRDRLRTQLVGGAERPDGDLTPVGDQDLGEHGAESIGCLLRGADHVVFRRWCTRVDHHGLTHHKP